jgi:hypothetical protein
LLSHEIGQLMMNPEDFEVPALYEGLTIPRYSNVHVRNRFLEILSVLTEEYKEENK